MVIQDSKVLPFARKWLNSSQVNTSDDGSTPTTFTFDSPIFLQEGIEYCVVLYSDSVDYTFTLQDLAKNKLILIERYQHNLILVFYLSLLTIEVGLLNKWKI